MCELLSHILTALELEIRKFIGNKNIIRNIYRTHENNSIMWGYICIKFIDFKLKGKSLELLKNYPTIFSSQEYQKNDRIILKYFQ